jgi:hypothetical protein
MLARRASTARTAAGTAAGTGRRCGGLVQSGDEGRNINGPYAEAETRQCFAARQRIAIVFGVFGIICAGIDGLIVHLPNSTNTI